MTDFCLSQQISSDEETSCASPHSSISPLKLPSSGTSPLPINCQMWSILAKQASYSLNHQLAAAADEGVCCLLEDPTLPHTVAKTLSRRWHWKVGDLIIPSIEGMDYWQTRSLASSINRHTNGTFVSVFEFNNFCQQPTNMWFQRVGW